MAHVIDFCTYLDAKENKKKKIKMISALVSKRDSIVDLIQSINGALGVCIATRRLDSSNQITENKHIIDSDVLVIILAGLQTYASDIQKEIEKLQRECV